MYSVNNKYHVIPLLSLIILAQKEDIWPRRKHIWSYILEKYKQLVSVRKKPTNYKKKCGFQTKFRKYF